MCTTNADSYQIDSEIVFCLFYLLNIGWNIGFYGQGKPFLYLAYAE